MEQQIEWSLHQTKQVCSCKGHIKAVGPVLSTTHIRPTGCRFTTRTKSKHDLPLSFILILLLKHGGTQLQEVRKLPHNLQQFSQHTLAWRLNTAVPGVSISVRSICLTV